MTKLKNTVRIATEIAFIAAFMAVIVWSFSNGF